MKSVSGVHNATIKDHCAAKHFNELDQCNYNVVPTLQMDKQG